MSRIALSTSTRAVQPRLVSSATPTLIARLARPISTLSAGSRLQSTPNLHSTLTPRRNMGTVNTGRWPSVTAENPLGLDDPTLFIQKGIIDGKYVDSSDGTTFNVYDPASGKVLGTAPDMTVEDTRAAIKVAAEAFKTWSQSPVTERQKILEKFNDLIVQNANDIARLIVWENGKSWADAYGEALYSASFAKWFAGEATRQYGDVAPSTIPGQRNIVIKQPIGVCALLVPWNFPAGMIARKVSPVVASGCTAVIKADPQTPFTNQAIMELLKRAGLPDGVVNVITCDKHLEQVGNELTTNKTIRKVSFTGSTRVGKILAAQSATTLKKLSLELGGNAPLIVFEDADIPTAVSGTIASKFRGSGQTCVCANRIYVHEKIYDEFAEKLAAKVSAFKVGSGFDEGVTHGPLINGAAADKVQRHIDDAVEHGAKIIAGGKREGNLFTPTVLSNVPDNCLIAEEETFGPLAALIKFRDEDHVVALANAADVGLAGYFFTQDPDRIWRVAEALEVGMVGANTGSVSSTTAPFGGWKESGYGKEGGYEGIEEFTVKKLIAMGQAKKA